MNIMQLIQIGKIGFDETQSRLVPWEGDEKDETLQSSIEGTGLIHEIIVRPTPKHSPVKEPYILVVGSRRFSAMIQAGMNEVPCKVMELSDVDAVGISLNENLGRKNLSALEKVRSIQIWNELLIRKGLTEMESEKEIAKGTYGDTNNGRYMVRTYLKASQLPKGLKVLLKEPDKRTKEEIKLLRDRGVPSYYKMSIETAGASLEDVIEVLGDLSDSEKTDTVLSIIGDLELVHSTAKEQQKILKVVRTELEAGKSLSVVMKKLKKERRLSIGHAAGFEIIIPAMYEHWHAKAMAAARAKDAGDFVTSIYIDYLKKRAKKEGW